MEHQSSSSTIYIPLQTVTHLVNLSASSIRRLEIAGDFPKKRKLSARRVGYLLDEISDWAKKRSGVLPI